MGTAATAAGVAVIPKNPGQPDDKVVVAGTAVETVAGSPRKVFAVIRYNADGTPDSGFGTGGVGWMPVGEGDATATSLVLLPSGYAVVGGSAVDVAGNHVFGFARFSYLGTPDTSFGTPKGYVLTSLGVPSSGLGDASVEALTLAYGSSTEVLAAGYALDGTHRKLALASYDIDGNLESSSLQSAGGLGWTGSALAPLADGGAIVAGDTSDGGWGLARFNSTLTSLTADFGALGKAFAGVRDGGDAHARALLLDPSNAILEAGDAMDGGVRKFALARFDSSGALDPSFGTGGVTLTRVEPAFSRAGFVGASLGNLFVGGNASDGTNYGFGLASYDSGGHLDPGFGDGGVVFTPSATRRPTTCLVARSNRTRTWCSRAPS